MLADKEISEGSSAKTFHRCNQPKELQLPLLLAELNTKTSIKYFLQKTVLDKSSINFFRNEVL